MSPPFDSPKTGTESSIGRDLRELCYRWLQRFALVAFPIAWVVGLRIKEAACVLAVLTLLASFVALRAKWRIPLRPESGELFVLRYFALAAVPLVALHLVAKVFIGEHGVDFSIFSRLVDSVASGYGPNTTLVGTEKVNFFTHHFTPILYLLGLISALGIPGYLVVILFQAASISLALYALYHVARQLGFSHPLSLVLTSMFCLTPTFRGGTSWAVHDELFALGFVGCAFMWQIRGRSLRAIVAILFAMMCKETFFAFAMVFSAVALVGPAPLRAMGRNTRLAFVALLVVSTAAFVFWFFIRPQYFVVSLDSLSRVSSLSDLLSLDAGLGKLSFVLALVLPTLALAFFSRAGIAVVMCAIPFWGAVLISNFSEMWKITNYYGVLPGYCLHLGALLSLSQGSIDTARRLQVPAFAVAFAVSISLAIGFQVRPILTILKLRTTALYLPGSIELFNPGTRVVASEFDLLALPASVVPLRLWTINRLPHVHWDAVIARATPKEEVWPALLQLAEPCFKNDRWSVWCRKGQSSPLRN
jgi:uncharacterized membrane protein